MRAHSEEIERVREEERARGRKERERLSDEWHRAAAQREVKFCEEVKLVREEGERKKWEVVKTEQNRHQQEMGRKPVLLTHPSHHVTLTYITSLTADCSGRTAQGRGGETAGGVEEGKGRLGQGQTATGQSERDGGTGSSMDNGQREWGFSPSLGIWI